jgi:archaemetzincin
MDGVVLCWIGEREPRPGLVDEVALHLRSELRQRVRAGFEPERPREAMDRRRGQYDSGSILKWLESRHADASKVLGVTDVDLFIPILTFVFGEAQLSGRAAVVSTARLDARDPSLLLHRLRKESLHELGHAYGLVHCGHPGCVMARSPGVSEIDTKGDAFCPDCRLLYDESRRHAR